MVFVGGHVSLRIVCILVALMLAGCASSDAPTISGLSTSSLLGQGSGAATSSAGEQMPLTGPASRKRSLASKVLAAIALERVTGRKPDPSRLTDVN